jgi:plastocyanin
MNTAKLASIAVSVVFTIFVLNTAMLGATPPSASTSQPAPITVQIENFAYIPREVDIPVGATVIWQNADDVPHTATSKDDPQVFDSGPLDTDDKFSFTFTKPGTYAYYCKVHPHMTGVVVVK